MLEDLRRDVLEAVVPHVLVEDARLAAVGVEVAAEGVGETDVGAAAPLLVVGVAANVAHEEVEQAVVVVVEEDGARGVADVVHARLLRDVLEVPVPVVLEEDVAAADRRDEQVHVAVVVDVREGGRDADPIGQRHARFLRDVPEPAVAEVLPELVAADLVDEVDVREAVPIHVGRRDPVAVVVVDGLVGLPRVVHDAVDEGDAAFLHLVGEVEVVEDLELADRGELGLLALGERQDAGVGIREEHALRAAGRRRARRGECDEKRRRGEQQQPAPANDRHQRPLARKSIAKECRGCS